MKKTLLACLWAILTLSLTAQSNARRYVDAAAMGANSGQSWTDAFTELAAALQLTQAGDSIWVAAHNYYPTLTTDRNFSFVLPSGVKMFGGFAGTETELTQRDWVLHPTVLSGDIGIAGDSTDNSYNVLYLYQPDSTTVLDGFVIRDGNAAYTTPVPSRDRRVCGGGLYIEGTDADAYPDIVNCRFEHNTARNFGGGAMVNGSGDGSVAPRFRNCIFERNRATSGGGIARLGGSWVERGVDFEQCEFRRNHSSMRGGGVYYADSERSDAIQFKGCRFVQNFAAASGAGAELLVGRLDGATVEFEYSDFCENISSAGALRITPQNLSYLKSLQLLNCRIESNRDTSIIPTNDNAIIYIDHLGNSLANVKVDSSIFKYNKINGSVFFVTLDETSSFAIINSVFTENKGNTIITNSSFTESHFKNTIFSRNTSYDDNWLFLFTAIDSFKCENCIFYSNNMLNNEYGLFFLLLYIDVVNLQNCVFIDNKLYSNSDPTTYSTALFALNSVFIDPPGSIFLQRFQQPSVVSHCYLDPLSCTDFPANYTCLNNLFNLDPLFVNPDSNDYRLQPCSPLVNAGANAYAVGPTDLGGQPRIQGGQVDIGAYETAAPALAVAPTVTPACPGTASGAADFSVVGGCPPFEYAWASAAGGMGQGPDGLVPGTYTFTINDARGSSFTALVSVSAGSPVSLAPIVLPVLCGDTIGGTATVAVGGALAPLSFRWNDLSTDSLHTGLPPGEYTVTVTDAIGCTAVGLVTVGLSGNLSVDISVAEISCYGAADASLTALPANGLAPFSWLWATSDTTATLGPVGPGDYAGTLTDAFGCSIGWVIPLGQPDSLAFTATVTPASGGSLANGSVLLDPLSGGTQSLFIQWSNGDLGPLADSLPAGLHTVTITDARGCIRTESFQVMTTGIGEVASDWSFGLAPNPAQIQVWVVLGRPAGSDTRVQVLDLTGRLVLAATLPQGAERLALGVADLPGGHYIVCLENEWGRAVGKLVVE